MENGTQSRCVGIGILVLLLSLLVTSFAKQSIVGKWKETIFSHRSANTIIEYQPDGTELITSQVGAETTIDIGRYKVHKNTITATIFGVRRNGVAIPLSSKMAKPQTWTFKRDGDTLLLTPANSILILTLSRVKS